MGAGWFPDPGSELRHLRGESLQDCFFLGVEAPVPQPHQSIRLTRGDWPQGLRDLNQFVLGYGADARQGDNAVFTLQIDCL